MPRAPGPALYALRFSIFVPRSALCALRFSLFALRFSPRALAGTAERLLGIVSSDLKAFPKHDVPEKPLLTAKCPRFENSKLWPLRV